jgi:hypothetical protein
MRKVLFGEQAANCKTVTVLRSPMSSSPKWLNRSDDIAIQQIIYSTWIVIDEESFGWRRVGMPRRWGHRAELIRSVSFPSTRSTEGIPANNPLCVRNNRH